MYLDKPMRDHVLLQAIARVNRPYEDEQGIRKPCGFVLDFVGIFDNLKRGKRAITEEAIVEYIEKQIKFSNLPRAVLENGWENTLNNTGAINSIAAIIESKMSR